MTHHGGFGAVVFIRAGLVNDLIKAAHFRHGDQFRAAVTRTFNLAGSAVTATGAIYLERPTVTLRRADGAARVGLSAWARLTVSADGAPDESCLAHLAGEVLVPFTFNQPPAIYYSEPLILDMSQFSLATASVEVPWISPLPGVHVPQLALSSEFRDFLVASVRPLAQNSLRVNVPITTIDLMELRLTVSASNVVFAPQIRPAAIAVLDDCVAAGFDVFAGSDRLSTGDAQTLDQPWADWASRCTLQHSLAGVPYASSPDDANVMVAFDPGLLENYGSKNLNFQLRLRTEGTDKRVDAASMKLKSGQIELHLDMTKVNDDPFPDDHLTVLVPVIPMSTSVNIQAPQITTHLNWLHSALDAFGGYVSQVIYDQVLERIGGVGMEINWVLLKAHYSGDLPGAAGSPGKAIITVNPKGTAIDSGWVLLGISAKVWPVDTSYGAYDTEVWLDVPDALPPVLQAEPPQHVTGRLAVDEFPSMKHVPPVRTLYGRRGAHIRDRWVAFRVEEHPRVRRDPSLRLRWTITGTNPDSSSVVVTAGDGWSDDAGSRTITVDLWDSPLYTATALDVQVECYRPPYQAGQGIGTQSLELPVWDRFRRDLPYARWYRYFAWKVPGARDEHGKPVIRQEQRRSAIHKTAIQQRCQFADAGFTSRWGDIEHLTTLPAANEDPYRTVLCPYCFRQG